MKKRKSIFVAAISGILCSIIGFFISFKISNKIMEEKDSRIDKFERYFRILDVWMEMKESGEVLANYFEKNNYHTIAIYGLGKMGNHLLKELEGTSAEILYAIDKNADTINEKLEIYTMENELPNVDVIVVTAVFDYENIKNELERKTDIQVVSLEDVFFESL